jgi:hypothetical protein
VYESLILIAPSVGRAMLALAIKEPRHMATQPYCLSFDQTDTSIIARIPDFDAVGSEIPEDGNE